MVGGPIFLFSKINKVTRARNINQKQKPICTEEKITSIHIEDTSQDLKPRQINVRAGCLTRVIPMFLVGEPT